MKILKFIRNAKIKLFCNKDIHNWQYGIWGNAMIDNLDDTFSIWDIGFRTCKTCNKNQYKLKNGWEEIKRGLTINDLK